MTSRVARLVATALCVATLAVGCGEREDKEREVLNAVKAMRSRANSFVYTDTRFETETRVTGILEDDFRYTALVAVGDNPAYEAVIVDDALALRVHNETALDGLVDPDTIATADMATELEGVDTLGALRSGRWLLDDQGAPPLTSLGLLELKEIGDDPVFDAVTALDYVVRALGSGLEIEEWREDDINPIYTSSEDRFPAPPDGVTRYDVRRPRLPGAADVSSAAGGQRALPRTEHFRKMALYVKDGRLVQVIEHTEIVGKMLETMDEYLEVMIREGELPQQIRDQFETARQLPATERGPRYMRLLNRILLGIGADAVLARSMSLELIEGTGTQTVALPTTDVVKGSLEALVVSRHSKGAEDATVEDIEGTTTTTQPGTETTIVDPSGTETPPPDGAPPTDDPSAATTVPAP